MESIPDFLFSKHCPSPFFQKFGLTEWTRLIESRKQIWYRGITFGEKGPWARFSDRNSSNGGSSAWWTCFSHRYGEYLKLTEQFFHRKWVLKVNFPSFWPFFLEKGEEELKLARRNCGEAGFQSLLAERGGRIGLACLLWGDEAMIERAVQSPPLDGEWPDLLIGEWYPCFFGTNIKFLKKIFCLKMQVKTFIFGSCIVVFSGGWTLSRESVSKLSCSLLRRLVPNNNCGHERKLEFSFFCSDFKPQLS